MEQACGNSYPSMAFEQILLSLVTDRDNSIISSFPRFIFSTHYLLTWSSRLKVWCGSADFTFNAEPLSLTARVLMMKKNSHGTKKKKEGKKSAEECSEWMVYEWSMTERSWSRRLSLTDNERFLRATVMVRLTAFKQSSIESLSSAHLTGAN